MVSRHGTKVFEYMRKNWVNDVLDDAVRAVRSWPSWMLRTEVRSPEGAPQSGLEDLKKARWHLDRAIQKMDSK